MGQRTLVPDAGEVVLDALKVEAHSRLMMVLRSAVAERCCPSCGRPSRQVHSRYSRRLDDLSWELYNDLDKTMLSHFGMNFANGIYTTAYRIVDFATVPIMSICTAAMPRMFQIGKNGLAQTAHLSFRLLRRALLIAALLAVGMFLCAPLLPKLVGKGFVESLEALRWLCLIPLFRAVHQIVGSALTGAGLQRYRTAMQFAAAAFNFALNLWLIPAFSWRGAAWSSLATDGGLGLITLCLVAILSRKSKDSLEFAK